jgi:hypothetical protein
MPCCLLSATHPNLLTGDNQLKKKPKKNTPQKKKLPVEYCSSAVIVFSPQFENIPNLYKKPVPYQLRGQAGSGMNKRSGRKQQGVTFRVWLVRLLPEPMTCPSCIITQLPSTHTAASEHITLSLSLWEILCA